MEFDNIRGFFYVAKFGSFTEAARRLYLTQPAISRQVKALEVELGEKLFDRVGRRIRLTHAGEMLFGQAKELVEKLKEIEHSVQEMKGLERGRLCLGASDTLSLHFLPELLREYVAAHPNIELRISSVFSKDVIQGLLARDIDIGIVTMPVLEDRVEVVSLFQQRFVCIAGRGHPFEAKNSVSMSEVALERVIALDSGSQTRRTLDAFFADSGSRVRPALEFSNFELVKRYVAAGLGVSVVPEGAVQVADDVCVVPLRERVLIRVGVAYRKGGKLTLAASSFLALAQKRFEGEPARPSRTKARSARNLVRSAARGGSRKR